MKSIIKVILFCFLLTNISGCTSKSTITQISLDPTTKLDDVYLEALDDFNIPSNYVTIYEFNKDIKQFGVNLSATNYMQDTVFDENKFEFKNDSSKSFTMINAVDDTSQRVAIIQDNKILFEATIDLNDILDEHINRSNVGIRTNMKSNNSIFNKRITNVSANKETLMYYSIYTPLGGSGGGSVMYLGHDIDPLLYVEEFEYIITCVIEFAY